MFEEIAKAARVWEVVVKTGTQEECLEYLVNTYGDANMKDLADAGILLKSRGL